MSDAAPLRRGDYRHFLAIPTRWIDNDIYGHVNNVVYYAYFDTVVNEHLIRAGGLDIRDGPAIGLVVETFCRFHRPLSFPGVVDAGLRVARLGTSSVSYEMGLFAAGDEDAAATGHFVHVWVDRATPATDAGARADTRRAGTAACPRLTGGKRTIAAGCPPATVFAPSMKPPTFARSPSRRGSAPSLPTVTRMTAAPRRFALIAAAGTSARFGGGLPKQYALIAGLPLLRAIRLRR